MVFLPLVLAVSAPPAADHASPQPQPRVWGVSFCVPVTLAWEANASGPLDFVLYRFTNLDSDRSVLIYEGNAPQSHNGDSEADIHRCTFGATSFRAYVFADGRIDLFAQLSPAEWPTDIHMIFRGFTLDEVFSATFALEFRGATYEQWSCATAD